MSPSSPDPPPRRDISNCMRCQQSRPTVKEGNAEASRESMWCPLRPSSTRTSPKSAGAAGADAAAASTNWDRLW